MTLTIGITFDISYFETLLQASVTIWWTNAIKGNLFTLAPLKKIADSNTYLYFFLYKYLYLYQVFKKNP